jgi:predicted transcriptional regulator
MEDCKEYHVRYLRAINNPVRRRILLCLRNHEKSIEVIQTETALDFETLKWHLEVLEYGSCIQQKMNNGEAFYEITQEGEVVDFMEA